MVTPEALLSISATSNEYFFVAVAFKTADLKCQRSTAFIETSFLNVSLYGHIKGIVENDQSKRTTCMWGMFFNWY